MKCVVWYIRYLKLPESFIFPEISLSNCFKQLYHMWNYFMNNTKRIIQINMIHTCTAKYISIQEKTGKYKINTL